MVATAHAPAAGHGAGVVARWVALQALWVFVGVLVYFTVRGLTEGSVTQADANARRVIALERRLGLDLESELQGVATGSDALSTLANWVYIWGHWPVIVATMIWLALRHRDSFLRLRDAMLISGAVGMVIFALFPVTPPRLLDLGLADTVSERSHAYRVLQPRAFTNQYAAMPSLHTGWDLLVGIAIVTAAGSLWLRVVGFVLPTLMILAVVVTANHYLLDAVAGVALVLVADRLAVLLARRRTRRPAARASPEPAASAVADPRRGSPGGSS